MGGYTSWQFGFVKDAQDQEAQQGGTYTGGKNGFLGAADFVVGSGNVSAGGGGWLNKVEDLITDNPGNARYFPYHGTQTITVFSVYGNVFYKHVGAQAGLVPIRSKSSFTITRATPTTTNSEGNQNDFDAFLVGRWGATGANTARWAATAGGGLYRYGSRAAQPDGTPMSPSANALSGFANTSVGIGKGLSVDASFWYTSKDKNYSADSLIGNSSQARFTVGLGYGR
jgi:hypothetical protein